MTARAPRTAIARVGVGVVAVLQATYAFLAFWDLAHRRDGDVHGPRAAWIPVILVNWIGPTVYFMFGIRR
ncbi:PLDc N-terminal domain-containing protein [Microbacterium sp. BWT-B31]|uniref:PLDc N-terminal domain-containing protein n=1 Tax=Microbacterium sp. BWT-B31 TaxID=3232072 RepID=UPI0035289A59